MRKHPQIYLFFVLSALSCAMMVISSGTALANDKLIVLENDFTYDESGKRDPLWSLLGHRGTIVNYDKDILATDLILEGVMAEPSGGSIAIINGNIVNLGDKIGLFIVKDIQTNAVILEKGEETFTLKLKKEE